MRRWLVLVLVLACGPKPAPRGPGGIAGLLAYVPADTPWVIATAEPLELEHVRSFKRLFAPIFDAAMTAKPDPETRRVFDVIGDEVGPDLDEHRIEALGFSARPHIVAYGIGAAVAVVRIEIRDRAAVLASIERMARKAAAPLGPATERHGHRVYRSDGIVFAFAPDQIALAFGKGAELDRALDRILARPARSLADTPALADAIARHHLDPHFVALVDTAQLVRALAERAGLHPSGACERELATATALAPRVAGSLTWEAHRQSGKLVLELAPALRAELAAVRVPLPAAAGTFATHRLVNLAVGVDLARGQRALAGIAAVVQRAGAACGWPALRDGAERAATQLAQPLPRPFADLRGLVGSLVTIALGTAGPLPDRIEGFAVLYGVPAELVELAQKASVPADGQMHAVQLAPFGFHLPYPIAARIDPGAAALAIGDKSEPLATRALAAPAGEPAPLLHWAMDYGRILELSSRRPNVKDRDVVAMMANVYGYTEMMVDVTDEGLVGTFDWELK